MASRYAGLEVDKKIQWMETALFIQIWLLIKDVIEFYLVLGSE